uniref:Uncharacterized protein n=1 Tax=Heterorhabditis bacteriophora TaxID=37862 RepID=A0A1I7WI23_HETBA
MFLIYLYQYFICIDLLYLVRFIMITHFVFYFFCS